MGDRSSLPASSSSPSSRRRSPKGGSWIAGQPVPIVQYSDDDHNDASSRRPVAVHNGGASGGGALGGGAASVDGRHPRTGSSKRDSVDSADSSSSSPPVRSGKGLPPSRTGSSQAPSSGSESPRLLSQQSPRSLEEDAGAGALPPNTPSPPQSAQMSDAVGFGGRSGGDLLLRSESSVSAREPDADRSIRRKKKKGTATKSKQRKSKATQSSGDELGAEIVSSGSRSRSHPKGGIGLASGTTGIPEIFEAMRRRRTAASLTAAAPANADRIDQEYPVLFQDNLYTLAPNYVAGSGGSAIIRRLDGNSSLVAPPSAAASVSSNSLGGATAAGKILASPQQERKRSPSSARERGGDEDRGYETDSANVGKRGGFAKRKYAAAEQSNQSSFGRSLDSLAAPIPVSVSSSEDESVRKLRTKGASPRSSSSRENQDVGGAVSGGDSTRSGGPSQIGAGSSAILLDAEYSSSDATMDGDKSARVDLPRRRKRGSALTTRRRRKNSTEERHAETDVLEVNRLPISTTHVVYGTAELQLKVAQVLNNNSPLSAMRGAWKIVFNPFSNFVAVGFSDGEVAVWKTVPGNANSSDVFVDAPVASFQAHTGGVMSMVWTVEGFLITGGLDGKVCAWRPMTKKRVGVIELTDFCTSVDAHPVNPRLIAAGQVDGVVYSLQLEDNGDLILRHKVQLPDPVSCVRCHPSIDLVLVGDVRASVHLVDMVSGEISAQLQLSTPLAAPAPDDVESQLPHVTGIEVHPNQKEVLVSANGYFPETFMLSKCLAIAAYCAEDYSNYDLPIAAVYSSCGSYIVSGSERPNIYVWDRQSSGRRSRPADTIPRVHHRMRLHCPNMTALTVLFLPKRIVMAAKLHAFSFLTSNSDGRVFVWTCAMQPKATDSAVKKRVNNPIAADLRTMASALEMQALGMLRLMSVHSVARSSIEVVFEALEAVLAMLRDSLNMPPDELLTSITPSRMTRLGQSLMDLQMLLEALLKGGGPLSKLLGSTNRRKKKLIVAASALKVQAQSALQQTTEVIPTGRSLSSRRLGDSDLMMSRMSQPKSGTASGSVLNSPPSNSLNPFGTALGSPGSAGSGVTSSRSEVYSSSLSGSADGGLPSLSCGPPTLALGLSSAPNTGNFSVSTPAIVLQPMSARGGSGAAAGSSSSSVATPPTQTLSGSGNNGLPPRGVMLVQRNNAISYVRASPLDLSDQSLLEPSIAMSLRAGEELDEEAVRFWTDRFGLVRMSVPFSNLLSALEETEQRIPPDRAQWLQQFLCTSASPHVQRQLFSHLVAVYGPIGSIITNMADFWEAPWFYPRMTSEESEMFLINQPVGTYLVRQSQSRIGYFVMSTVIAPTDVNHFLIRRKKTGQFVQSNRTTANREFPSFASFLQANAQLFQTPFESSIPSQPYFFGMLEVEDAEALLRTQPIGTFLVRFSQRRPGQFVASYVSRTGEINHSLILNENGSFHFESNSKAVADSLSSLAFMYSATLSIPIKMLPSFSSSLSFGSSTNAVYSVLSGSPLAADSVATAPDAAPFRVPLQHSPELTQGRGDGGNGSVVFLPLSETTSSSSGGATTPEFRSLT